MKINAETLLCASIAHPNRTSKAPIMHNAGFEALGLNFVYLAFEPTDLAGTIQAMRVLGIRGYSVSKPYKEAILQYLDEIDEVAKLIGAVNTVHNREGRLVGYNSDWIGAVKAVEEVTSIEGKKVLIVGAGGAGRAIAFGMKQKGAQVVIYNRTQDRARRVSQELGVQYGGGLDALSELTDYDVLINATSTGFYPNTDATVIPKQLLRPGRVILDVVFNPVRTRLIHEAATAGCKPIVGTRMLVLQGGFQFELFTGCKPPLDIMQQALEAAFSK